MNKKIVSLRILKLFVLFGIPCLGFLYAYQFVGQDREVIVPFKTFKVPETVLSSAFSLQPRKIEFKAPITIVNFWASWCPPCVEEFPAMVELQRQLEGTGVEMLFVSVDDNWQAVQKFVKDYNLQIRPDQIFLDSKKLGALTWGSSKFPETYVVRRDGWVLEKIIGAQQWTRPAVIRYFTDLGTKFKSIGGTKYTWSSVFESSAYAQSNQILHEDDKRNLEKLRTNIETASKNQRNIEAALREERRNLEELKVGTERKTKEERESEDEVNKLRSKRKDVKVVLDKNTDSQSAERSERKRDEDRIKKIQGEIKDLQRQLDDSKSRLLQANKDLNTRIQQIDTFEEARKSSQEELDELEKRIKFAESVYKERSAATEGARREQQARERKVKDLGREVEKSQKILEQQKDKLKDFEIILQK